VFRLRRSMRGESKTFRQLAHSLRGIQPDQVKDLIYLGIPGKSETCRASEVKDRRQLRVGIGLDEIPPH
jgi:hypothetical protein